VDADRRVDPSAQGEKLMATTRRRGGVYHRNGKRHVRRGSTVHYKGATVIGVGALVGFGALGGAGLSASVVGALAAVAIVAAVAFANREKIGAAGRRAKARKKKVMFKARRARSKITRTRAKLAKANRRRKAALAFLQEGKR
jgi:hypothetical protein